MPKPDIVTQALSTNPYESELGATAMHLSTPTFTPSEGSGLQDLGRALGLASVTLEQANADAEKRQQKYGVYAAQQIVQGQTDENMHKLNAIDMIGTAVPDMDLQDNHYAVSTVEHMRGTYLGTQAADEYQTWRATQPKVKTPQEEVQRYEKFIAERQANYMDTTTNPEAFLQGFDEKKLANSLVVANEQRQEQAKEFQAIAKGTTSANLTALVRGFNGMSEDDFLKKFQDTMNGARIAWMDPTSRIDLVKEALQDFAMGPGKASVLTKLADIQVGTQPDGTPVKIGGEGGLLDMNPLYKLANQRTANLFGERVSADREKLRSMNHAQQNAYFENLQKNEPDFFETMTNFRQPAWDYYTAEQKRLQAQAMRAQAQQSANAQIVPNVMNQLAAWRVNGLFDVGGNRVATGPGDLPKISVTETDENGRTYTKSVPYDQATLTAICVNEVGKIQARQDLSDDQKMMQTIQTIAFPGFSQFQESVKNQFRNAINGVNAKEIETDPEGWVNANEPTLSTLKWYRTSPTLFQKAFGPELSVEAGLIQNLADSSGGDYAAGLSKYAIGRERLGDTSWKEAQGSAIRKDLLNAPITGFPTLDGASTGGNTSSNVNAYLSELAETNILFMKAAGLDDATARTSTESVLKNHYGAYGDTLIPFNFFDMVAVDPEDKVKYGKLALDALKADFESQTGSLNSTITYQPQTKTIVMSAGGGIQQQPYTMNDIAYYVAKQQEWRAQKAQENMPAPPTLAEIMAQRAQNDPPDEPTQIFFVD